MRERRFPVQLKVSDMEVSRAVADLGFLMRFTDFDLFLAMWAYHLRVSCVD